MVEQSEVAVPGSVEQMQPAKCCVMNVHTHALGDLHAVYL